MPVNLAILGVCNYYDEVGTLLHKGLVDVDLVSDFLASAAIYQWNKLKPIIEGYRKDAGYELSAWFEYLVNEMQKYRQSLQQSEA